MNKNYMSFLAVAGFATALSAQQAPQPVSNLMTSPVNAPKPVSQLPGEKALGQVVFLDDFTNATSSPISGPSTSVASNWTIDNSGQTGAGFGWDTGTTENSWYFNAPIASPSGGNFAELNNGNPSTGSQALDVTYTITTTNPIDINALAGSNDVTLEFYQYGARFNDLQEVQISFDGNVFQTVYDNLGKPVLSQSGGSAYANPDYISVDLAPILGTNMNPIYIRFSWTTNFPSASTNPNVWVTYGWMLDDVAIRTKSDYDLEVIEDYFGSAGLFYHKIPQTQVAAIDFSDSLKSNGTMDMTNVQLNVNVTGAGTYTGASTGVTVAAGSSTRIELAGAFTPSALGAYTVARTITATETDDLPGNNVLDDYNFEVTQYDYARDNLEATTTPGQNGNGVDPFKLGNYFDIYQNQTVYGMRYRFSMAPADIQFTGILYELDPAGATLDDALIAIAETEIITTTATGFTNQLRRLPFLAPTPLEAGKTYMLVLESFGGGTTTNNLRLTTAGTTYPQTSFLFDPTSGSTGTWFYTTNTPVLRLDFDPTLLLGVDENEAFNNVSVYPNPANDVANVSFALTQSNAATVQVIDVAGKVVYNTSVNGNGSHTVEVPTAALATGIYTVTITSGEAKVVEKLVKK